MVCSEGGAWEHSEDWNTWRAEDVGVLEGLEILETLETWETLAALKALGTLGTKKHYS